MLAGPLQSSAAIVAAAATLLATIAAVPAPAADDAAPAVVSALGISRTEVRVRFSEAVNPASVAPADFSLSMGGEARTVTRAEVAPDALTANLTADRPWPHGTAGILRLRGSIADPQGHASAGARPAIRVWASPGDVQPPTLTRVRLTRKTVCVKGVSRECEVSGGSVAYTVDEPVSIVIDLRRRSTDPPSTLRVNRSEGPGAVRFKEKIEGRRLRPGTYRLTVTAVDAAQNESTPVVLSLRVRH